ncbi:kelch repeat and BTB domain-containing protein 8-like isoform 1-T1 [Glossina fuscipes fuscipes]
MEKTYVNPDLFNASLTALNLWRSSRRVIRNYMKSTYTYCDFNFILEDGEQLYCHQNILGVVSPYFDAMFNSAMEEKSNKSAKMQDIDANVFRQIVDYCYTGEISLNEDNVKSILSASNFFQIDWIVNECKQFLVSNLKPTNCLGIWKLAGMYFSEELHNYCQQYVLRKFSILVDVKDFSSLSLEELIKLVSSDNLMVPSEDFVYQAITKWIKADFTARESHLAQLIDHVRLPYVGKKYLLNRILTEDVIKMKETSCEMFPKESSNYKLSGKNTDETQNQLFKKRKTMRCNVLLAGGDENRCMVYNTLTQEQVNIAPMNEVRCYNGVVRLNDTVYSMGGLDKTALELKTAESYNISTNKWTYIPPMDKGRAGFGICALNGLIYVCGGYCGNNSVECYNPATAKWGYVANLTAACEVRAVVLENCIYCVISGSFIERFDPREGKWYELPMVELPNSCGFFDVVACGGHYLYRIGGFSDEQETSLFSVNRFNLRNYIWEDVAPMNFCRREHSAVEIDGDIYVFGGSNERGSISSVECYNTRFDKWSAVDPIQKELCCGGAVEIPSVALNH